MPNPIRRMIDPLAPFAFGQSSDYRLPIGQPHTKLYLKFAGTVTPTVGGLTVRPRGLPIRKITIITDGGNTVHTYRGRDLLQLAEMMLRTPLSLLYTAPAGSTNATPYGFSGVLPIPLSEPFVEDPIVTQRTAFPSFAYRTEAIVRVDWGDATEMFSGGATGTLTGASTRLMVRSDVNYDAAEAADPNFASKFLQTYASFQEVPIVAGNTITVDLPKTEDTRNLFFFTEDANGNFADGITTLRIEENGLTPRVSDLDGFTMQAEVCEIFQASRPPGLIIAEFCPDGDLSKLLESTKLATFQAKITPSISGTLRILSRRIGPVRAAP